MRFELPMDIHTGTISVILAVYNVAPYLRQCLDSIMHQTYQNLEIFCVDDGSSDTSGLICDEYAAKDPRFKVIHQKNLGVSSARNHALNQVCGQYVYFADGDDWLDPDMLETLLGMMDESNGVQLTQCGYSFDYPDRCVPATNRRPVPEVPMPMRDFLYYIYYRDEYRGVASYLHCKLFPSSLFDGRVSSLRFSPDIQTGEDVLLAAQCYILTDKTQYTSRCLYHYRQRGTSAMHNMERRLKDLGSVVAYEQILYLFEEAHVDSVVLDYVKRFYVYHAAVLLQYAQNAGYLDKALLLKEKILPYLETYRRTNEDHPQRIRWIESLLDKE